MKVLAEMHDYDSIIIGAGHNGLVCASYLARGGQRVLLLEAGDTIGGLAGSREFHPGFKASIAHSFSHFPNKIVTELRLGEHGLLPGTEPLKLVGLGSDGDHITLQNGELNGVGSDDAEHYREYDRLMQRFAAALEPFWLKTMPRIGNNSLKELGLFAHIGLKLRMLGQSDMREFLRVVSLPTRDLMDENFENDLLKAMLSWDGLVGSRLAPRSPNAAILAMLYRLSGGHSGSTSVLMQALRAAAEANGVDIRTGAHVDRILIEPGDDGLLANGVQLADGEKIVANKIVSSADPQKTFLRLVGVENLEIQFTNRIRRLRCDGLVAKLHLALSSLPEFTGLDNADARMIIAPAMDAIEFAFDDAKYGECSQEPVMEVVLPSLRDESLAPAGQHVLSAHIMYVPNKLKGGWTDAARSEICERAIGTLERYAPDIRQQILGVEFLTPHDLEQQHGVTGGHWHHTELAMDQVLMMRPTYEAAQYATPIPGLYLCGAGSHPGGDVTGAPGHNAAAEILK